MLIEKIKEMEEEHIKISLEKFTLSEFLEDFSLLIDNEENDEEEIKKDKVKLMTIHQAKGLEFKYVFIVGLEEGYYPCGNYINDLEELEEERRIFYVAITRAKINCYLSYAIERLNDNESKRREQSRFLEEINDPEFIQIYEFENNYEYRCYENKYRNEFNNTKKIKNKTLGKFRKFSQFEYSDNDHEKNLMIQNRNNFSQNIYFKENQFMKASSLLKNSIHIEKLDVSDSNNMNIEEKIENAPKNENKINKLNENLNNKCNNKHEEIKQKRKVKIEKSRSKDRGRNKSKLKFSTIDSFFNPK